MSARTIPFIGIAYKFNDSVPIRWSDRFRARKELLRYRENIFARKSRTTGDLLDVHVLKQDSAKHLVFRGLILTLKMPL